MSDAKNIDSKKIEVISDGSIAVPATPDQLTAWSRSAAAAELPVAEWLADAADAAAVALSYSERKWPVVIELKHPIDRGGQRISKIEMKRGNGAVLKGMKIGGELPMDQLFTIASRLSGQFPDVIEKLDPEDLGEVTSVALDFYGRCLGGGRTRSR